MFWLLKNTVSFSDLPDTVEPQDFFHISVSMCVCEIYLRTHEDFFSQLLSSLRKRYPKTITLDSEK